jgi:hypothetical protein
MGLNIGGVSENLLIRLQPYFFSDLIFTTSREGNVGATCLDAKE